MDSLHLEELARVEGRYWWNVAKTKLAEELLTRFAPAPGRLVEGGPGACGNLRRFREVGYEVLGLDASPEAVAHGVSVGLDVRVHDLEQRWPVADGSARAVVLLDVIEHLAEPVATLRRARDALSEDGRLLVTVPAYPWLMGPWDHMLGHRRRYTRSSLVREARCAGLASVWVSHWNVATLPVACAIRFVEGRMPLRRSAEFPKVPDVLNQALVGAMCVERRLLRVAAAPAGTSIVGVFRR